MFGLSRRYRSLGAADERVAIGAVWVVAHKRGRHVLDTLVPLCWTTALVAARREARRGKNAVDVDVALGADVLLAAAIVDQREPPGGCTRVFAQGCADGCPGWCLRWLPWRGGRRSARRGVADAAVVTVLPKRLAKQGKLQNAQSQHSGLIGASLTVPYGQQYGALGKTLRSWQIVEKPLPPPTMDSMVPPSWQRPFPTYGAPHELSQS